ncbi:hypothetical protein A3H80_02680 [Candidatus Roizmanbacteria bacterium RIFCSPLOWO2_02_FULL_37_19]|uniref:Uncharacterized protein n=1 Tax=Candidatus Roizmanbacteria bacterium RIFCSPHIGHO2_02_FULL_37_24 TaxID=1802037 RepID=A0A1F7H0T2_9BACT|nr:MAG: hypothetical protein A2862_00895 [Candidatus Roizmanbacteria bacterium RIFCSPHIGHO2_01_FULL_38_41]OGK24332.1 MAG: hypothetical protein A3C24_02215 [Candidatus Roizmanbacteria bacterium RIFCSPHIGHO2_02_FULL_37_24]OGK32090.1 MAG: hypothetical protein A3E10_00415 [Candidatus Roizmanbacteria bacterium RIFCSPHIGHO2_12_FULL_37_23]OGK44935.1 MAG: hypothetical protein A2956_05005 [Candidatus Roizmanbacteria bacterium RIFCSPLOWO2_01_FULL_37_57]OGK53766.1 MAG: hypothetical protein A3H80_02680 [Ca
MNKKELLLISITIFFTVVGWIVADLHHVASTQQVKEINPRFSREIKVDLRPEVIDKLEQKK